jgi:hypothetical protein
MRTWVPGGVVCSLFDPQDKQLFPWKVSIFLIAREKIEFVVDRLFRG